MPAKNKKSAPDKAAPVKNGKSPKKGTLKDEFPIVGIGASAGGLETLRVLFENMPGNANIAFVIIQHLSPQHKSLMVEILAKYTPMTVRQIEDGMRLSPGCIYLTPPNKNVAIFNRNLHLMELTQGSGINMPIDFFFRSLAEDQKERAIGIIVSGTATDGTSGIKAIKGEGGMAMVQEPATAKYDGMPRSAVATGMVDFIVPVEKMPKTLLGYIQHPFLSSPGKITQAETDKQQLSKMYALIRTTTGHDFSKYKPNTMQRRIERRLAVHQLEKLSDYLIFLQKTPSESKALFKDLLIGVTSFFRDPKAFEILEQQIEKILQNKKNNEPLRCWVVGCSTGEEAYSLAILISEAMAKLEKHPDVQIFSSDIDEGAIETARKGVYPDSIAADVSKERLKQFFTKGQGLFTVKKQIRDMIVFSGHSIVKDPPFSKLDLVSCRNLLIYMDTSLQKKIIPLFHYTLNPEGVLFLGSAETIGEFTDQFKPVDSMWRIYKRKAGTSGNLVDYPTRKGHYSLPESPSETTTTKPVDLHALAERKIMEQYAPAAVLINDRYEILHFVGRTERYLVPPTGKPSFNVLDMARMDIKFHLTTALHKAKSEKKRTTRKDIRVQYNGDYCIVDLCISPFDDPKLPPGLLMVIFEEKSSGHTTPDEPPKTGPKDSTGLRLKTRQLEQELHSTREHLQATIEELETSNEELRSTNEEMQSVNEEMQSTNEELETSKEELQSTNEELNTVNTELQNKVQELSKVSDDMNNLLAATDVASIFLDIHLRIKRYTPAAARIIKLIPSDIGRPLNDLKTSFPQVDLTQLIQNVLDHLNTLETEIESENHAWYQLKAMPYRTTDNVIDGVVLTLVNIQKQVRQSEDKVRRFATVLEDSNDAVTVHDFKGRILAWNKGAEKMYGWTQAEALKMNAADLLPEARQNDFQALIDKIKKGETIQSFKSQRKTKNGHVLNVWLTATVLADESGRPVEMATTERDLAWFEESK